MNPDTISEGFKEVARRMKPVLDSYQEMGVHFALEVHPTEIAFDIASAEMILEAVGHHPAFGFNYDPSHMGYQGVDYLEFIRIFADRIFHVHCKDIKVYPEKLAECGVMAYPLDYMSPKIPGLGDVNWGAFISALNDIRYDGDAVIEVEDKAFEGCNEDILKSIRLSKRYLDNYII